MFSLSLSEKTGNSLFYLFSFITVASVILSIAIEEAYPCLIPLSFLFICFALFDFKKIYFLLIALIPITKELTLSGTLALDLPGEPLLIILMFTFLIYMLKERNYDIAFLNNPVIQLLLVHLLWIFVTIFFSYKVLFSLKFFLAKVWYVATYVFLTGLFVRKLRDFKVLFWSVLIPTVFTIIMILLKHAQSGFSFEEINTSSGLFYRNHVNYAAFISLLVPFIWLASTWYKSGTLPKHFLNFCKLLFLVAVYFAFARGAWMALFAAVAFYYGLKYRLLKYMTMLGMVLFILIAHHLVTDNNYLSYAPDFYKTIYHGNIIDHIKATIRNQDISTAERFYRWVAGVRMSGEHPITGFGPGSFYYFYQQYAVTAFTTWVSDNPERSGTHNYFLLTVVEQGLIGLFIFLLLTISIFYCGVKSYHRAQSRNDKNLIAAVLCSMVIIYVQLMLSDLVEEIKTGGFFFVNIALLVNWSIPRKKQIQTL